MNIIKVNFIKTFRSNTRSIGMKRKVTPEKPISKNIFKNVTIFGAGKMGTDIGQIVAQAGYQVIMIDKHPDTLTKSKTKISNTLSKIINTKFRITYGSGNKDKIIADTLARIKVTTDVREALIHSDLAIEAIPENLKLKQEFFGDIEQFAPLKTIFTTSTNSYSCKSVAKLVVRKDRFLGLHFYNPHSIRLIELVKLSETSDETLNIGRQFIKSMGKIYVECKDVPGYIVNRLLIPYIAEAIRMIERGDATKEDIDNAIRVGAKHRMGPIQLADFVGLDNILNMMKIWNELYCRSTLFIPCKSLQKLVSEGKLGMKSGEGYFKYKKEGVPGGSPDSNPVPLPDSKTVPLPDSNSDSEPIQV